MSGAVEATATTSHEVLRALSANESLTARVRAVFWLMSWLRGELDQAALTKAVEALRRKHPVLAAQLEPEGDGFQLVANPQRGPAVVFHSEPLEDFTKLPGLALADGTSALLAYPHGEGRVVAFGVDHAIADAQLTFAYNYELWELYTQIVATGDVPQFEPQPIAAAPEAALDSRGVHRTELPSKDWFAPTAWGGKQPGEIIDYTGRSVSWRHRFTSEFSAELRAAARRLGTTVNGLVTGAIALAERALIDSPPQEPVNLGINTTVDFRNSLNPPAEVGDISNGTTLAQSQVFVRADDDPVRIGAAVLRQIKDDLASGALQQGVHHWGNVIFERPYGPGVMITNPGVLPAPPTPEGLVIADSELRLAIPEISPSTAQSGGVPPHASQYYVYSFDGRLSIRGIFPTGSLTGEQIATLREGIAERLGELARRAAA